MKGVLMKFDEEGYRVLKDAKKAVKDNKFMIHQIIPYVIEDALNKFIKNPDCLKFLNGDGIRGDK